MNERLLQQTRPPTRCFSSGAQLMAASLKEQQRQQQVTRLAIRQSSRSNTLGYNPVEPGDFLPTSVSLFRGFPPFSSQTPEQLKRRFQRNQINLEKTSQRNMQTPQPKAEPELTETLRAVRQLLLHCRCEGNHKNLPFQCGEVRGGQFL
ncbi:hypothetical protein D4764_09G0003380 [Takifugu flavidus]|uniref:Uncharacterized protein n=1 Tax=Takifugu flavidus TaxID=433684 RepID=A0A5C6MKF3_9TELE|nr:hypothetical protein D4764_09G0003380 [Takifugu flavidus]